MKYSFQIPYLNRGEANHEAERGDSCGLNFVSVKCCLCEKRKQLEKGGLG